MEGSSFDACFNGRGIRFCTRLFVSRFFVLSELINMNQHGQTNFFSYQAIDLLRDIPQHLKDLIFLFQRNITLFAVRTILESNLTRNLL